jgi:hypothetical protein
LRRTTRDLWDDGLDGPALGAARRAAARGTRGAAEALADLEARGGRSVVARAIVLRLAEELSREAKRKWAVLDRARGALGRTPELN